jgi:DNA-binding NarL/FixJ family response regulator
MMLLLVEDNHVFRCALKETLSERFPTAEIFEAAELKTAQRLLEDRRPDLVIMDIRMPDGDAISFSENLLKHLPDLKIIILTSFDTPEHRNAAAECGAMGFFVKGETSTEELGTAVQRLLCL